MTRAAARPIPRDLEDALRRAQWAALVIAGLGVVGGGLALLLDPDRFFQAYLTAYLLWLALTVGCLALVMLHHLAGGRWGALLLRFWEAGVKLLPLWAVLFLPLLLAMGRLYPWAVPESVAEDPVLQFKQPYLNVPFFILRAVLYFGVWSVLGWVMVRNSAALDEDFSPARYARMRLVSGAGLAALGLTATFAIVDWMMSLEPHWYSSIYPPLVAMGAVLGAFAASLALAGLLSQHAPLAQAAPTRVWNDLGSLLLTFVMLWAYLALSQYLIIWYGNLQEEIPWYLRRQSGGWEWLALALVAFSFAVPFLVLLARGVRRSARALAIVAALVVLMRVVEVAWLVGPAFYESLAGLGWPHLALLAALGGLWTAGYCWWLRRAPLLPLWDPRVQPGPETAGVEHAPA